MTAFQTIREQDLPVDFPVPTAGMLGEGKVFMGWKALSWVGERLISLRERDLRGFQLRT